MKLKLVAAALAAVCSSAAFAYPSNTLVNPATGALLAPTNTYYIAGASAQAQAVNVVIPRMFDAGTDFVKITQAAGGGGFDTANDQKHVAYLGLRGGVSTLVIYRNAGGSGAGIEALLSKTTADNDAFAAAHATDLGLAGTEHDVLSVATCTNIAPSPAAGPYVTTCTSHAKRTADVALTDVAPINAFNNQTELASGVIPVGSGFWGTDKLVAGKTGIQGFGVIANPNLYAALQKQNVREGSLPASCTAGLLPAGAPNNTLAVTYASIDKTAACQPSIRRADYASLISGSGAIKDANALLNTTGLNNEVTVCRRVNTSGTQASSNMFFLNNVCGNVGFGGANGPLGVGDSAPGQIQWTESSSTGNVKTCVNDNGLAPGLDTTNSPKFKIGVVSLENAQGSDTWQYVKLDGVSPNFTYDKGTSAVALDPQLRQQFMSGAYPYAPEMYASYRNNASAGSQGLGSAVTTALKDSTIATGAAATMTGVAFIDNPFGWAAYDSTGSAQNLSRVTHNGNNCSPLQFQ